MSIERVSPARAKELLDEGYVYLDVRSVPEFEGGHPEGALCIPLLHADPARGMVPNADFLAVTEKVLPKDAQIVVGCASGGRSLQAARLMAANGWANVVDQRAGFVGARNPATGAVVEKGWQDEGLPTGSGTPDDRSYEALKAKAGL